MALTPFRPLRGVCFRAFATARFAVCFGVAAKPLDGYKVDVEFDTGERGIFDCTRYLDKPYWKRLNDKDFFRQVFVGYGTLVWPDEIDIGPEDIWEFAQRY